MILVTTQSQLNHNFSKIHQRMSSRVIVKEQTDREIIRFTLEWTINKFKQLRNRPQCLRSAVGITMRELGQDDFQGRWRVGVNACSTETKEGVEKAYIGVFLILTDVSLESVSYTGDKSVDVEFVMRVSTGKEASANVITTSGSLQKTFCSKDHGWGLGDLVSHGDLFGDDKKPGLLKDDSLTLVIEVTMYGEPKAVIAPKIRTADSSQRYQQFIRRQAIALASNTRLQVSDFEIHSNDGQVFPTYRVLLMSHSAVFAAMLYHDSKENRLSRCELDDVDGETVGVLLDYVYGCDTRKVTVSNAEKVLMAADKYAILDLRAVCEEMLAQSVTGENAVHYLVLASQRNLDTLKEAVLNVIPKNMSTVLKNGALQEAMQFDPELVQTIMEHCSKRTRPNDMS